MGILVVQYIIVKLQGGIYIISNRSSVSHTIRVPGFKYDVLKGELSKGSHISKIAHPIPEVELFKETLLQRKVLKDM